MQPDDATIRERLNAVAEWILCQRNPAAAEQRHLDAGSVEQLYWHIGYYQALNDLRSSSASTEARAAHTAGIAN